ncbi:uncharacterized protein B0I36DRAFT_256677, partial [Microdochium trichocladiopsis]
WIDTCCIDKSHDQELQEGINSMFRWFREGNHCYVYLTDVRQILATITTDLHKYNGREPSEAASCSPAAGH